MTKDNVREEPKQHSVTLEWFIALLSVVFSLFLYAYLIGSNCESEDFSSFMGDVRAWHTSEGC